MYIHVLSMLSYKRLKLLIVKSLFKNIYLLKLLFAFDVE